MANGTLNDFFGRISSSPLIGFGLGVAGAPQGASFGQAANQGFLQAIQLADRSQRNELTREQILNRKFLRERAQARDDANATLVDLLMSRGGAATPAAGGAAAGQPGTVNQAAQALIAGQGTIDNQTRQALTAQQPGLAGPAAAVSPIDALLASAQGTPAGGAGGDRRTMLAMLAKAQPEAFAQSVMGAMLRRPQVNTLAQKIETLEGRLGRDLTAEEMMDLGGGLQINTYERDLDKAIPLNQLPLLRNEAGDQPKIGTTMRQAGEEGFKPVTAKQLGDKGTVEQTGKLLSQLNALAIGSSEDPGIFQRVQPGFLNRAKASIDFFFDLVDQGDPRAQLYQDLSQGAISSIVRSLGAKGALSDPDIDRALGLVPQLFPLADTGEVAGTKLKDLERLINKGYRNLERGKTTPGAGSRGAGGSQGFIDRLPATKEEFESLSDEEFDQLLEDAMRPRGGGN